MQISANMRKCLKICKLQADCDSVWEKGKNHGEICAVVAHVTENTMEFESNQYLIRFQRYL